MLAQALGIDNIDNYGSNIGDNCDANFQSCNDFKNALNGSLTKSKNGNTQNDNDLDLSININNGNNCNSNNKNNDIDSDNDNDDSNNNVELDCNDHHDHLRIHENIPSTQFLKEKEKNEEEIDTNRVC